MVPRPVGRRERSLALGGPARSEPPLRQPVKLAEDGGAPAQTGGAGRRADLRRPEVLRLAEARRAILIAGEVLREAEVRRAGDAAKAELLREALVASPMTVDTVWM
jgi:hypothetical protein